MTRRLKHLLLATSATAAMLGGLGAARAASIDFERLDASPLAPNLPAVGHGDSFEHGGFWFDASSYQPAAQAGDLVGAVVDGSDLANTCFAIVCPTNNASHFYSVLNDGVLAFGRLDRAAFRLSTFDASFIANDLNYYDPLTSMLLAFEATTAAGAVLTETVALPGPVHGVYSFRSYRLPASFAALDLTSVALHGLACDQNGTCSDFTSDEGQFGIDNLAFSVAAVPEPASWLLLGLGLPAIAAAARRRQRRHA